MRDILYACLLILCIYSIATSELNGQTVFTESSVNDNDLEQAKEQYKRYRNSNRDSALFFLESHLTIAEQIKDKLAVAKSWFWMAKLYRIDGQYKDAVDYYLKAAYSFRGLNDYLFYADVLNDLGSIAITAGNYIAAMPFLEKSYIIYDHFQDSSGLVITHTNQGLCQLEMEHYERAKQHYEIALHLAQSAKNRKEIHNLKNYLGELALRQCFYKEARNHYQSALVIGQSVEEKAILYNNIGESHLLSNNLDSAEWYLRRSLDIKKSIQASDNSVMISLINIGQLNLRRQQNQIAVTHLEKAIDLGDKKIINRPLTTGLEALNKAYSVMLEYGHTVDQSKQITLNEIWPAQHTMLWDLKNQLQSSDIQNVLYYNIKLKQTAADLALIREKKNLNLALFIGSFLLFGITLVFFLKAHSKIRQARRVLEGNRPAA